jgi:hypothetical protein
VIGAPGAGDRGAPQTGVVYVIEGRSLRDRTRLDTADADQMLEGPEPSGRFGWSMALVDLNADGVLDLAVSSPTTGAADLELKGKVWVYFGTGGTPLFSSLPDVLIQGDEPYTRLGWTLGSGDVNGNGYHDLLVGAPFAPGGGEQRGLAAVYLSSPSVSAGTQWGLADAGWLCQGEQDYDWFGAHLGVGLGPAGEPQVLVGAPGLASGGIQAAGRIYAYASAVRDPEQPVFTVTGESEFDKVGAAFVVADLSGDGNPELALAAPTRSVDPLRQPGQVYLLDMGILQGQHLLLGDLQEAFLITGDREFGRLGWRLAAGHVNRDGAADLLVTEPWLGNPIRPVRGGATLWMGGPRPSGATRLPFRADARVHGSVDGARLGDAAAMADVNGDGFDDPILAASRDSTHVPYGGSVSVYFTPPCHDRDEDGYGDPASLSCRFTGWDCNDEASDDPEACTHCACGTRPCAACARCMHPGAREFAFDGYDSNCSGYADCFIAQAAFDRAEGGKIDVLRAFRDRVIPVAGRPGIALVDAYYEYGPWLARRVQDRPVLRGVVRVLLLPLVGLASLGV